MVKVRIRLDENLGYLAGISVVLIIGKYWLVPDMGYWEIVLLIMKGMIGL